MRITPMPFINIMHRLLHSGKHLIIACLFTVLALAVPANSWAATSVDVTDIYNPSSLVALQDTTVTAMLENSGDSGYFPLSMYIDGYLAGSWQIYMDYWTYGTVDISVPGGFSAGYHMITICADYCWSEGFTWTGTPDLTISDIYSPTTLNAQDDATITAKISNIGNADAGSYNVAMYIDDAVVGSWPLSGLPANYYTELGITITGGLSAGSHSISFIADSDNAVSESNEWNNDSTDSWTWVSAGPADLTVTDRYNPTSLLEGENSDFKAQISSSS